MEQGQPPGASLGLAEAVEPFIPGVSSGGLARDPDRGSRWAVGRQAGGVCVSLCTCAVCVCAHVSVFPCGCVCVYMCVSVWLCV